MQPSASAYQPTERELVILELLRTGHSDKLIADSIKSSQDNVNRLIIKMRRKYQCHNRCHLVSTVIERGIVKSTLHNNPA